LIFPAVFRNVLPAMWLWDLCADVLLIRSQALNLLDGCSDVINSLIRFVCLLFGAQALVGVNLNLEIRSLSESRHLIFMPLYSSSPQLLMRAMSSKPPS